MTPDNGTFATAAIVVVIGAAVVSFATAAYVIAAIVYLAYVLTLKLRLRRLRERMIALDASPRPRSDRPEGA